MPSGSVKRARRKRRERDAVASAANVTDSKTEAPVGSDTTTTPTADTQMTIAQFRELEKAINDGFAKLMKTTVSN